MKHLILPALCTLALGACQAAGSPAHRAVAPAPQPIEITGSASTTMTTEPMVPPTPGVTVYPLDGPALNPLTTDRTHSVLDNTTAGGYTVFDPSVKIYPLPGEAAPAFLPDYAVPPLETSRKPVQPHVGQPVSLASSSGLLPPVPTRDVPSADPYARPPVSGAVRTPITLTAVEPVTMQPPSAVRPPMDSPFPLPDDGAGQASSAPLSVTSEGRRSSPLLTGY